MTSTTSQVIKCENISVMRGSATILQQVSLHANRGELVAILGPNGAKTFTLFVIIVL